jgi:prepilin-type N-terminal cleavage/methylation domain-containing protein
MNEIKDFTRKGFTLIEILIVVAIIAILASIVLVGLGPTQQSGRDARRLSDLHEIQNGLELFYNKCGYYPGSLNAGACSNVLATAGSYPASAGASTYGGVAASITAGSAGLGLSTMPNDPTGGATYRYTVNGSPATQYILGTTLENGNNSVFTSYTAPVNFTSPSGDTYNCAPPTNGSPAYYCVTL